MTNSIIEHSYGYLSPSVVTASRGETNLALATSGGQTNHPFLAEGFVANAQVAARMLLAVANIAQTRFWRPPNMIEAAIRAADPVVTAANDRLRFESFSPCGGVYARFDLDTDAFDGGVHTFGTTNIDVNPPMRAALAKVGSSDPMYLQIGTQEVAIGTLSGRLVEKQVPLPPRWVRGFAEVSVSVAGFEPKFQLLPAQFQSFLRGLPISSSSRNSMWVVPSGSTVRLSTRPADGGLKVGGVERLRLLRDVIPFSLSLTAYGPPGSKEEAQGQSSVWVFEAQGGRLSIALSPMLWRGFSGEGGLLLAIAKSHTSEARGDRLARVERAYAGRLGYDVSQAAWFERALPFNRTSLEKGNKRLADASKLVSDGAITPQPNRGGARVHSGSNEDTVRRVNGAWRCTCPWWSKHQESRGPCKHILAAVLFF